MFDLVAYIVGLDFSHNFEWGMCVYGIKIAQQSTSSGDNCTPLRGFFIYLSLG